jgi:hypothetical protein
MTAVRINNAAVIVVDEGVAMKASIAGMLFGLVASTTAAFAASSVAHDGTFWTRLTRDSKVS